MTTLDHPEPEPKTCATCAAWCNDQAQADPEVGQCRYRAPQPYMGQGPEDRWCTTSAEDWCLDHITEEELEAQRLLPLR